MIPTVASPLTVGASRSGGGATPGTSPDVAGGQLIPELANPLSARMHKGVNTTMDEGQTMVPVAFKMRAGNGMTDGSRGAKPGQSGGVGYLGQDECAFTLSTSEDQMVAVPFAFKPAHFTRDKDGAPGEVSPPLSAEADKGDQEPVVVVPYNVQAANSNAMVGPGDAEAAIPTDVARSLDTAGFTPNQGGTVVRHLMAVRRLTPRECERLQGFPDDYTLIRGWKGQASAKDVEDVKAYLLASGYSEEEATALARHPDGPRYKALGNSWAVPNMRWIFRRIQKVEDILKKLAA